MVPREPVSFAFPRILLFPETKFILVISVYYLIEKKRLKENPFYLFFSILIYNSSRLSFPL